MRLRFDRDPAAAVQLRSRTGRKLKTISVGLVLGLLAVLTNGGSPARAAGERGEPQVARVAFYEGEVSYLEADAEEWAPVAINAPLVAGDHFYSGPDGRAELQLPGGFFVRVANNTEIDLLEVSSSELIVRVGVGTATFRLRQVPAQRHIEISTPATAVVARARGIYRVDVDDDGRTTVVVREGEADAYQGDERYRLVGDRAAEFIPISDGSVGDVEPVQFYDAANYELDPWDEWESSRARRFETSASLRYVSDDYYSAADLDEYGTWNQDDRYGPIWRPTSVAVGWAPFTQGRWVWQDPWGWSWVDYQPWGWAPSHYGRWVYAQSAWAWAPGPIVSRPIYTPATVGFLGVSVNTPGFSFSFGASSGPPVGWVPLGYGEPVIPWWGGFGGVTVGRPWWGGWDGPRIVNNTVINNTNITNINVQNIRYANYDNPWAVTAVDRAGFVRGEVQRIDLPRGGIDRIVRPIGGPLDIVPQRESLFAARPERVRSGRALRPSDQTLQRAAVVTRDVPPAPSRFEQRRELIQRNRGAPVPTDQLRQIARQRNEPQVRTVAATGRRSVVPEATARFQRGRGAADRVGSVQRGRGDVGTTGPEATRDQLGRTGRDRAGTDAERAAVRGTRDERSPGGREQIEGRSSPGSPPAEGRSGREARGASTEREQLRGSPRGEETGARSGRLERPAREPAQTERAPRDSGSRREREALRGGAQSDGGQVERGRRAPASREEPASVRAPRPEPGDTGGARRAPASRQSRESAESAARRERGSSTRSVQEPSAPHPKRSVRPPERDGGPQSMRSGREQRAARARPEARAAQPEARAAQPDRQSSARSARDPRESSRRNPTVRQPSGGQTREAARRAPEARQSRREVAPPQTRSRQPDMERPRQSSARREPARVEARSQQRSARAPSREQAARQSAPRQTERRVEPTASAQQNVERAPREQKRRKPAGRGGEETQEEAPSGRSRR